VYENANKDTINEKRRIARKARADDAQRAVETRRFLEEQCGYVPFKELFARYDVVTELNIKVTPMKLSTTRARKPPTVAAID
jgi:hypothetical protein